MSRKIILIGAGDTGTAAIELLSSSTDYEIVGFLDDAKSGYHHGFPILGKFSDINKVKKELKVKNVLVTISLNLVARKQIVKKLVEDGFVCPVICHKSVLLSPSSEIGIGTIVFPYASIGHSAWVGNFCIVKPYVRVSYHAKVGDLSLLSPYCFVGSYSHVGKETVLYTRTTISPKISIGERCVVYAHSVVVFRLR